MISRRHREHQTTGRHEKETLESEGGFKKVKRGRRITLTLGHASKDRQLKAETNPENYLGGPQYDISEFKIESGDGEHHIPAEGNV